MIFKSVVLVFQTNSNSQVKFHKFREDMNPDTDDPLQNLACDDFILVFENFR